MSVSLVVSLLMSNSAALCSTLPTVPILKSRGQLRVGFSKVDLITVIWKRKKQIHHQSIENSWTENQSQRNKCPDRPSVCALFPFPSPLFVTEHQALHGLLPSISGKNHCSSWVVIWEWALLAGLLLPEQNLRPGRSVKSLGHVKEPFINHPEGRRSLDGGNLALRCGWPWWFWHIDLTFSFSMLFFPHHLPFILYSPGRQLHSIFWALICGSASLTIVVLWTLFGKIQSPLNLL